MRVHICTLVLAVGVLVLTGACATARQWAEWEEHPTHFASGGHAIFSLRNPEGEIHPRVSRADIEAARRQRWWGEPVTVSPSQIFQN